MSLNATNYPVQFNRSMTNPREGLEVSFIHSLRKLGGSDADARTILQTLQETRDFPLPVAQTGYKLLKHSQNSTNPNSFGKFLTHLKDIPNSPKTREDLFLVRLALYSIKWMFNQTGINHLKSDQRFSELTTFIKDQCYLRSSRFRKDWIGNLDVLSSDCVNLSRKLVGKLFQSQQLTDSGFITTLANHMLAHPADDYDRSLNSNLMTVRDHYFSNPSYTPMTCDDMGLSGRGTVLFEIMTTAKRCRSHLDELPRLLGSGVRINPENKGDLFSDRVILESIKWLFDQEKEAGIKGIDRISESDHLTTLLDYLEGRETFFQAAFIIHPLFAQDNLDLARDLLNQLRYRIGLESQDRTIESIGFGNIAVQESFNPMIDTDQQSGENIYFGDGRVHKESDRYLLSALSFSRVIHGNQQVKTLVMLDSPSKYHKAQYPKMVDDYSRTLSGLFSSQKEWDEDSLKLILDSFNNSLRSKRDLNLAILMCNIWNDDSGMHAFGVSVGSILGVIKSPEGSRTPTTPLNRGAFSSPVYNKQFYDQLGVGENYISFMFHHQVPFESQVHILSREAYLQLPMQELLEKARPVEEGNITLLTEPRNFNPFTFTNLEDCLTGDDAIQTLRTNYVTRKRENPRDNSSDTYMYAVIGFPRRDHVIPESSIRRVTNVVVVGETVEPRVQHVSNPDEFCNLPVAPAEYRTLPFSPVRLVPSSRRPVISQSQRELIESLPDVPTGLIQPSAPPMNSSSQEAILIPS